MSCNISLHTGATASPIALSYNIHWVAGEARAKPSAPFRGHSSFSPIPHRRFSNRGFPGSARIRASIVFIRGNPRHPRSYSLSVAAPPRSTHPRSSAFICGSICFDTRGFRIHKPRQVASRATAATYSLPRPTYTHGVLRMCRAGAHRDLQQYSQISDLRSSNPNGKSHIPPPCGALCAQKARHRGDL